VAIHFFVKHGKAKELDSGQKITV